MKSSPHQLVQPDSTLPLSKVNRILLLAGLVPVWWFLVWTGIGGALAPGYSALSQQGSELTLLPGAPHLCLDIAAIGAGTAFLVFAAGLWMESGRKFALGSSAWMLFGLAMMSNGIWKMGSPKHGLYAIGLACIIAPAMSLLEMRRLRDNRVAFLMTAIASGAAILYLWLSLTGNDPAGLRGLTQRIFSSINSLWPAVIVLLLLRRKEVVQSGGIALP
ncbi:MAG TPA: DUF998 domain-containing protein [Acidobacteriaceae bacterium]|nr:DUF998 domain-containing protein [Acidobacteriaceae bacterium]